jgi:hypothetical protein
MKAEPTVITHKIRRLFLTLFLIISVVGPMLLSFLIPLINISIYSYFSDKIISFIQTPVLYITFILTLFYSFVLLAVVKYAIKNYSYVLPFLSIGLFVIIGGLIFISRYNYNVGLYGNSIYAILYGMNHIFLFIDISTYILLIISACIHLLSLGAVK